jgi:ABC-2 type transport system ATP-binding protein
MRRETVVAHSRLMTQTPTHRPAVRARGLVKTFGEQRAVDGIDLEVPAGQVFGVLGPNGAGKTTTLKMLATLLPIDEGEAQILGVDVSA